MEDHSIQRWMPTTCITCPKQEYAKLGVIS